MRAGRSRAALLALAVQEKCVVVLTSFGCLRNKTDLLAPIQWSGVALDEGHRIRNPHAEVSIAARSLRTPHRYLLTGAPLQNSLLELWALFDWIMPGKLGSRFAFDEMFSIPIKQGGCVCAGTCAPPRWRRGIHSACTALCSLLVSCPFLSSFFLSLLRQVHECNSSGLRGGTPALRRAEADSRPLPPSSPQARGGARQGIAAQDGGNPLLPPH